MKLKNIVTTTYQIDENHLVDIVYNGKTYDAWISRLGVGVKEFVFGVADEGDIELNKFLDLVLNYIVENRIAELYDEKYY